MDISIKCDSLKAIYSVKNGMLRCVAPYEFTISLMPMIKVCIEEVGNRIITFTCKEEIEAKKLYSLLQELERLLQISELFDKWRILLDELGVVNQMYLYATSSAGFTNDVKCAFLVELSESLMEIIQSEDIKLQRKSNREGKLKSCLRTIINYYGKILFRNEIEFDLGKILSCLVNTRVNIMHIKINQRKPALDGRESVLYAIKMSYLYRLVILEKLKINAALYKENLKKRVVYIDGWNDIQKQLFDKLK